ncbi:MAG TPA: hypothetical protein VFA37_03865 [Gaiellaceae bacterium]|nr:hypothetical protein [Gaiellaceae bacterium]
MESIAPQAAVGPRSTTDADATEEELLDRHFLPAIAEADSGFLRYAIGTLAALLVVLAAVFAFNAIVDPFSLIGERFLPPAVEPDRSIKLDLIQKLKTNPQVVVLGSSRSRQAEPSFIDKLTGLKTGFNAGVTGGTASDAWVMTQNIAARFPHGKRSYIWFLDDQIATNGINPQLAQDPRSRGYLGNKSVRFSLADVGTYIGFQATRKSFDVVKACIEGHCQSRIQYNPDGSLTGASLRYLPEDAPSLKKAVAAKLKTVRHASLTLPPFKQSHLAFFEKTLAWMNAHGSTPVIVLNPIYPSVYRLLQNRGSKREAEALAELHKLQRHYRFVVVDCSDIRVWGGKARDFNNATHVNRRNMRRMLRYIVAHSHGALTR